MLPGGRLLTYPATPSAPSVAQPSLGEQRPLPLPPPANRQTHTHTRTVASAQAQARISGAEARRASIDGQITRQGPVGRERRQCCSHSGPLSWRPYLTPRAAHGSPKGPSHHGHANRAVSHCEMVTSDSIASRPHLGQETGEEYDQKLRWEPRLSGIGNLGSVGSEKGEPRKEQSASQMPCPTVTWIMDRRSPWQNPPMKSPVYP